MKLTIQNTVQFLSNPNLRWFFRSIFLLLLIGLIYLEIRNLDLSFPFLALTFREVRLAWILAGVLLIIPNYFFEVIKWKLLGEQLEFRSYSNATQEVLRGLRWGIFTPLMVGDYYGRTRQFQPQHRPAAMLLNLYNSLTQTWTALFFGAAALLLWYAEKGFAFLLAPGIAIALTAALGLLFLLIVNPSLLKRWKITHPYFEWVGLPIKLKVKVLCFSLLRSSVYNLQYVCFYLAFGISLSTITFFIGINILLLIKTVGGGLNLLGDLTLRELVSIHFFGMHGIDERLVLIATFVVWIFTVIVPVLLSTFYAPSQNDITHRL